MEKKINNKPVNYPKILPHNLEAEQAILGCLLVDTDCSINVIPNLNAEDFYVASNQKIYKSMYDLYNVNSPIDFITVTDELEKHNLLSEVGGLDYITSLTNIIPSAENHKHYLEIIKRDSILRKLIHSSQEIIENAYSTDDKDKAITLAEKAIFDISEKETTNELEQIAPSLNEVFKKFETIAKDPNSLKGISTGFKGLDNILNGFQKSDLILLAARPSVGKSTLAMQFVNNAALAGKKCAVFSLEMPRIQIAQRSLCSIAYVSMEKALKGQLSPEEWNCLWAANKKLATAEVYIDDTSLITPIEILSKCRRLKREHGLDLVMIDYLQLMNSMTKSKDGNRQSEISEITRYLKIAARELDVPIIVLSQLSRAIETRKDHKPMLSDLRESGSIEQDADIVIFIHNPSRYSDIVTEDDPNTCEILIEKHRNGSLGAVKLKFIGEFASFVDENAKVNNFSKTVVTNSPTFNADELAKEYGLPTNDEKPDDGNLEI